MQTNPCKRTHDRQHRSAQGRRATASCATVASTMKRRCGDREIAYDDVGTDAPGAPVVLLHPFPSTAVTGKCAAALVSAHRMITVDARVWRTPVAGAFTIADLADDLAALLDAPGVAAATVVGLSMGGYTALAFAQRHAARLRRWCWPTPARPPISEARRGREEARLIESGGVDAFDRSPPRLLAPDAPPLAQTRARGNARRSHHRGAGAARSTGPHAGARRDPLPNAGDRRGTRSGELDRRCAP